VYFHLRSHVYAEALAYDLEQTPSIFSFYLAWNKKNLALPSVVVPDHVLRTLKWHGNNMKIHLQAITHVCIIVKRSCEDVDSLAGETVPSDD